MAARKAADEAASAPEKLEGKDLPPPLSKPTTDAALLPPPLRSSSSAALLSHRNYSGDGSRDLGELSDYSSGSESPDCPRVKKRIKANAHCSADSVPSGGGACASAALRGKAQGGGSPLGVGLARTLAVVESNAAAATSPALEGSIISAQRGLEFCGPLLPPPPVTSDGISGIPPNNADFGVNLDMINAGAEDLLFLIEDLLTDEY